MRDPKRKIIEDWSYDRESLTCKLDRLRDRSGCVVMTNGCFDVFHAGHAFQFAWARSRPFLASPVLVVAVNDDASAAELKGKGRPVFPFTQRSYVVACHAAVNLVVGFGEHTPQELIEFVKPDVLVKGGEYENWLGNVEETRDGVVVRTGIPGAAFVRSRGGLVLFSPMIDGVSTTDVLNESVSWSGVPSLFRPD